MWNRKRDRKRKRKRKREREGEKIREKEGINRKVRVDQISPSFFC